MIATKILVIEDELNIRESLAELLELKDYEVITAKNGQEGIIRAIQHIPDLILCDVMMPIFDGYQVLALIRKNKNLANTPFLFLTAKTSKEDIREGMSLGADDYLTKPFTGKELFNAVEVRLSRSTDQGQALKRKLKHFSNQFSAANYHEINTPLTGVISTSRFLLDNFDSMEMKDIREMLQIVVDSGQRLHRTFNNTTLGNRILMAKLSEDDAQIANFAKGITHNPSQILEGIMAEIIQKYNREENIVASISKVESDLAIPQEYFEKIVFEVLDNAFKFSETSSLVNFTAKSTSDGYEVTIIDYGRGFKTGATRKIDAFQQFDRLYYEQQGSGIGLFLAKSLTEINGGSFLIKSEFGKFTRVKMTFNVV